MNQVRLKYVAGINTRTLSDNTKVDYEFHYLDIGAVGRGVLCEAPTAMTFASAPSRARRVVTDGDTIVSTVRTYLRAVWPVRDSNGDLLISTGFAVLTPGKQLDPRFLGWLAQSDAVIEEVVARSVGVSYPAISPEVLGDILVPLPSTQEQVAIADYLDAETARIDALIEKKRRMMELLGERRISAAHAAVTGVSIGGHRRAPDTPWLGTIPSHWQVVRVGSVFEVQLGRMLNAERSTGPHLRRYLRNLNVRWDSVNTSDLAEMDFPPGDRSRYLVRPGDLLVNEGGAGIGRAAIWDGEVDEIYYQKSIHRVRPRGALSVRWLLEWLRVAVDQEVFKVEGNLATIPHVPAEALRQYRIPCPQGKEEQRLISELDATIKRDVAVRQATEAQMSVLQERRQALITAAVTGELDIPGVPT